MGCDLSLAPVRSDQCYLHVHHRCDRPAALVWPLLIRRCYNAKPAAPVCPSSAFTTQRDRPASHPPFSVVHGLLRPCPLATRPDLLRPALILFRRTSRSAAGCLSGLNRCDTHRYLTWADLCATTTVASAMATQPYLRSCLCPRPWPLPLLP